MTYARQEDNTSILLFNALHKCQKDSSHLFDHGPWPSSLATKVGAYLKTPLREPQHSALLAKGGPEASADPESRAMWVLVCVRMQDDACMRAAPVDTSS